LKAGDERERNSRGLKKGSPMNSRHPYSLLQKGTMLGRELPRCTVVPGWVNISNFNREKTGRRGTLH